MPARSQITLGGAPNRPAISAKSKINVLGHYGEALGLGKVPKHAIGNFRQPQGPDVTGLRKEIDNRLTELETEVLIEQQLHIGAVINRLSRSAA